MRLLGRREREAALLAPRRLAMPSAATPYRFAWEES
jgi:hypothetical protein